MVLRSARRAVVATAAGLLALGACGDGSKDASGAGSATGTATDAGYIVATTGIWADIAGRVACDGSIDIRTIVPAGGDPHSFEPSLRDREVLDGALLVVTNGLGLEETLADTLDAVADGGVPVFAVGDHVDTLGDDPHIWFDPTRVADALPALGDALVAAGAERATIDECVTAAQGDLRALDEEVTAILADVPAAARILVTNHDALGYFADRYGFTILGSVLPSTSTLTEASPGQLEDLGEAIEEEGVPAIFTERLGTSTDAEALADRLGVEVVELYSDALGQPGTGAETYDGLLRTDASAIAAALSDARAPQG
jgi:zinc/manganese transport system substrate-binding protein